MTTVSFAQAPAAGGTVSFTAEQVARGENAYQASCSGCHGTTLGGEGEAPGVIGSGFRDRRFSGTADTFFLFLKERMPQQDPGSLTDQEYADIVAFLMDANGFEAGTEELPADPAVLATLNNPPAP